MKLFANGVSYKKTLKGKKGSVVLDVLIGAILFVTFAIAAIFGFKVLSEVNTAIQGDDDMTELSQQNLQEVTTQFPKYMDNAFLMLIILFWILIIVTSFFIDTYPVFFIISFLLMIIVFVIGMYISNVYEEVVSEDGISTFADSFPKMNWIMGNFLMVLLVMGGSSALALYSNSGGGV